MRAGRGWSWDAESGGFSRCWCCYVKGTLKNSLALTAVGALWTCLVGHYSKSSVYGWGGSCVWEQGLGTWGCGEDGGDEKRCLWCKRVFDFCLRLFLHFVLNSLLAKMRKLRVKVWRASPFMRLSASVVGLASLSFCSYFSVLQRIFNPFLPALAGGETLFPQTSQ